MNWLLAARCAVLNIVCIALLVICWVNGWVADVLAKDTSHISIAITLLFLFGLGVVGKTVFYISRALNTARETHTRPQDYVAVKNRLAARLATVNEIGGWLVMLGLIGTVWGFIQSLTGVKTDGVMDTAQTLSMVVILVQGMQVALYTTLVGSVFYLWLRANYRIAANGATKLISQIEQKIV